MIVDSNLISGALTTMEKGVNMITLFKFVKNTSQKEKEDKIVHVDEVEELNCLSNRVEIESAIELFRDNRVYVTKKTRINSEERMNRYNFHSILILNLYTFTMLCYSILAIKYPSQDWISMMSLIVSIALFGASVFVSLYGFREKALAYKMSHLKLAEIESKLDLLLLDKNKTDNEVLNLYGSYQQKYNDVISKTENHHSIDYVTYKHFQNDPSYKIKYYRFRLANSFVVFLLYILPFVGLMFYFI